MSGQTTVRVSLPALQNSVRSQKLCEPNRHGRRILKICRLPILPDFSCCPSYLLLGVTTDSCCNRRATATVAQAMSVAWLRKCATQWSPLRLSTHSPRTKQNCLKIWAFTNSGFPQVVPQRNSCTLLSFSTNTHGTISFDSHDR